MFRSPAACGEVGGRLPTATRRDSQSSLRSPPSWLREMERARQRLRHRRAQGSPVGADARADPRVCALHTGSGRTASCCCRTRRARLRGQPADLQPRRVGGRAVRQRRARGDHVPAPPRLDRQDEFSIQTAAGEIRPRITGADDLHGRHGAACSPRRTSLRRPRRHAHARGGRPRVHLPARLDRQPAVLDRAPADDDLEALDLPRYGAPIESNTDLFPNRTNVSFWRRDGDDEITARIFERGVGETLSSGTGASGAAVAFVLRGGDSPGHRPPGRRRPRGRGRGGPAREPDRLGRARLQRRRWPTNSSRS